MDMTQVLCESCQEEFEIVEEIMIYGDEVFHKECFHDYCLNWPNNSRERQNLREVKE